MEIYDQIIVILNLFIIIFDIFKWAKLTTSYFSIRKNFERKWMQKSKRQRTINRNDDGLKSLLSLNKKIFYQFFVVQYVNVSLNRHRETEPNSRLIGFSDKEILHVQAKSHPIVDIIPRYHNPTALFPIETLILYENNA